MADFCPVCGSGKFFRTGDYLRGHVGITVGNFADPSYLMPDHIHWWPNRLGWAHPLNQNRWTTTKETLCP